jgi:hypothetical protein
MHTDAWDFLSERHALIKEASLREYNNSFPLPMPAPLNLVFIFIRGRQRKKSVYVCG